MPILHNPPASCCGWRRARRFASATLLLALTGCGAGTRAAPITAPDGAEAGVDAADGEDAPSGSCDLLNEPLSFDAISDAGQALHGPCDRCLQASCCDAVVLCFVNNADCTAITPCVNQCAVDCPPSGGGGGGGDGGGGGGMRDGGACPYMGTVVTLDSGVTVAVDPYDQCLDACKTAHQASIATYQSFSACYLMTCAAACPH